ncbi:MAG TPA: ammonium transporter [Pirellulales bacterium]|nr:ammonium transporter [Pirellulales bacterium]
MKRFKLVFTCVNIVFFLVAMCFIWGPAAEAFFDDPPAAGDGAEPKDEAPNSAGEVPAPSADPPQLPAYFTATAADPAGMKAGVWTTPSSDTKGGGDVPSTLDLTGVYDRVAHNLFAINMVWTLIAGFLVMFMQAGFAMVEGGLCRAKNSGHTMAMNLMIYPLGCLAFWAYGFALGWGNWFNGPVAPGWYPSLGPGLAVLNQGIGIGGAENLPTYGLMGTKGFFLNGVDDVSVMALFFFMMVFMDTTATIPTGSMAERWGWKSFCLYGIWVALPYCLYANWVWGGGWLAQMGKNWGLGHGAVDFAGSGVVHAMGGAIALAGALCLGPRIGKYINGKPQAIPGHSIPMVVVGTFILAFGWFGFNPGSTLSGTDLRIATVVVNTMLASITGALGAMVFLMVQGMKPDPSMMCNGMLAGLVAITAPCAFVDSWAAALIGAIAGMLVVVGVFFWDKLGVDDPVGAISVHGVNGLWGVISLGIFANGKYGAGWNGVARTAPEFLSKEYGSDGVRGALYGDVSQLYAQLIDAAVVAAFGFVMAFAWFKFSNLITPLRVSRETEIEGLDLPEMGSLGYPDFALTGHATDA